MRLSDEQIAIIRQVVHAVAGENAHILVFGSRLDDSRRGGDVDLLLETGHKLGVLDRAAIKMRLERQLGLPVDVLACIRGKAITPFQRIARETGVPI